MEEETVLFLKRLAETIGAIILWMFIQITFGVYKNYGFFEHKPTWQNIVFYIFFIASGIALYIYINKKWKPKN